MFLSIYEQWERSRIWGPAMYVLKPVQMPFLIFAFIVMHSGLLVRNDTARDVLRRQVGEIGVILFVPPVPSATIACT